MHANCVRRAASNHPYAGEEFQGKLPHGVWWHEKPRDNGGPGVLCNMPECTKGCYHFYLGVVLHEQEEFQAASFQYQEAHTAQYRSQQLYLNWAIVQFHELRNAETARQIVNIGLSLQEGAPELT